MKPEMREKLAQLPFEEKIRMVGELIRLRQKIKTDASNFPQSEIRNPQSGQAAVELDAGKGVRVERVRENIREWAKNSKK